MTTLLAFVGALYIICYLFCPHLFKKILFFFFVILPIIVALYTFAPTFLAVGLAVFMLIGAIGAVFNSYKRKKSNLSLNP